MGIVAGVGLLASAAAMSLSCASSTVVAPIIATVIVPVSPDSALKLARHALGEIPGSVQMPRVRRDLTTVSTHYSRTRRGGGQTQVAIMAGVARMAVDSAQPATRVELRGWMLDLPVPAPPRQRRSDLPVTAITTDAPVIRTPRAVTARDTIDAANLEFVLAGLLRHGARRVP